MTTASVAGSPRHPSTARLVCGYGVIAAVLPYVALKVLWLTGNMVGIPASSPAHEGWVVQNAVTLAMDVAAVVIALAFTYRWGDRVPSWLVIVPIWVATGFLIPAAIEVIIGFSQSLATSGRLISMQGGLVEPWAYVVVYLSFTAQGLFLAAGFVMYARERWTAAFSGRTPSPVASPTRDVQTVLAFAGAALAMLVAAMRLFQAFVAPARWRQEPWTFTVRLVEGVEGAFAGLAAVAMLGMIGAPVAVELTRRIPDWLTLALAWTGTGTMFGYGLLRTVSILADAPLSELFTPESRLINFAALLAGLVLGVAGALTLAERQAAADPAQPQAPTSPDADGSTLEVGVPSGASGGRPVA